MNRSRRFGFSMVGMLVTMACMLVLFVIGMNAMDKAVTGEGSAVDGTVRSLEDKLLLYALHQSMVVSANDHGGRYLTPSEVSGRDDISEDTTANLFSAMVMANYVRPDKLISGNEYSGWVDPMEDYDFLSYSPRDGIYWDDRFVADLDDLSNVSFAHMPLFGERRRRQWKANFGQDYPLLGNRGPKDGIDDPNSWSYGRNGVWGGHIVFGDGHIEFLNTFTPGAVYREVDGMRESDNIFAMEDGPDGGDAILSFTKSMSDDGPELQYD